MNQRSIRRKQRALNEHRGIPNRVPADEAAQHILALRSTMSWNDLATATGSSACHLRHIASGREPRINRGTHLKIMAVTATPSGWAFVSALGSRRRIRALQAIGHSQYVIAEAARSTQHRIYMIGNERTAMIRLHLADRITQAYGSLKDVEGTSARGRNLAAANGWPGPAYWDDDEFDNPDFEPATRTTPRYVALAEDCAELERQEFTRAQIAERLGVSRDGLQRALAYHRQQQTAA